MSLNDTNIFASFWCPHCKEKTIIEVNAFKIRSIRFSKYNILIELFHKRCEESFICSIKVDKFWTSIEGKIVDVE